MFDPAEVGALAGDWALAVYRTAYSPIPGPELERFFQPLLGRLLTALTGEPFTAAAAESVGAQIVAGSFTGATSLRVTVDTLGPRLLGLAARAGLPDAAGRVLALLSALGTGYTAAMREWLLDQQEQVKQALLRAMGRARRDLANSEARFREVFNRSAVGIALSGPDGALVEINPRLTEILGYPPEELAGRRLEDFFHPADAPALADSYRELRVGGERLRKRMRLLRADGTPAWVYLLVSVLHEADELPNLHLTMVEDVSDLHLLQGAMSFQSLHDPLTNLPNRQYLISRLGGLLGESPPEHHIALYHLDIDGFSVINDGFGVEEGDRVLFAVARRLEAAFPPPALVARVAGDEFAVLVRSGEQPPSVLADVDRITAELAEPVHLPGGGVAVSACIGVAQTRLAELDPIELLRAADVTLRRVQRSGRHQWALHDPRRDPDDRTRLRLAAALPGALEFGELSVDWQPWVLLAGGRPLGAAARLRWDHPELGVIDHQRVLELAERTGASLPLGNWLLGAVCRQIREWRGTGGTAGIPAGLGLTALQASDPDLIGLVRQALTDAGLEPAELWLGFPAPVLADAAGDGGADGGSAGEARENLEMLAGLGVGLVLTEVGSAAGDLAHAGDWPVRAVTFGAGFARRVEAGAPGSLAERMAIALAELARSAGLTTIVPDVASAEAAERWRRCGMDAACGPHFGPNIDGPSVRRLLVSGTA